jgi:hypothetical protein
LEFAVGSTRPDDYQVREAALDASRSFVVQAPAGSGKTGLLAGSVAEECGDAPAEDSHTDTTLALARAVVERDVHRGWSLNAQPARMRILTIDALCRDIATQMPWLSRLGGDAQISDDVSPLYRQAARDVVAMLHEDVPWSEQVATLVSHLDGDLGRFERMLVEMLSRRDQWLRYLLPGRVDPRRRRAELEAELARAVADELAALRTAVPPQLAGELAAVCGYAGDTLLANGSASSASACAGLEELPGAGATERRRWQGIAAVLLTKDGKWRKTLTRRDGFPPMDSGGCWMRCWKSCRWPPHACGWYSRNAARWITRKSPMLRARLLATNKRLRIWPWLWITAFGTCWWTSFRTRPTVTSPCCRN